MRRVCSTRFAVVMVLLVALLGIGACASATANAGHARADPRGPRASQADRRWIVAAHQADMAEVQLGYVAQLDGGSRAIRAAGTMLLRDHQALDRTVVKVAQALGVSLPQFLTVQQSEIGDRLTQETGHQFDHDFTASMMTAHQSLIAATRYEIAHGSSAKIVTLARQTLPVLIKHYKMLQAAAATG